MYSLYRSLTKTLALLVVALAFALIVLDLVAVIGGRTDVFDASLEIAVLILNVIGWTLVARLQ